MKNFIHIFIIICALLFVNCNGNTKADITHQNEIELDDVRNFIEAKFTSIDTTEQVYQLIKNNFKSLSNFYSSNEYFPVLLKNVPSQYSIDSLLNYFNRANEHGINPKIYNSEIIKTEFNYGLDKNLDVDKRYSHLANAEILLANSLINYSSHLRQGFVNPNILFAPDYEIPSKRLSNDELLEPLEQENILSFLKNIQPRAERYLKLQNALLKFETIKDYEWKPIPIPDTKIEPGNNYIHINEVVKRLLILDFIDTNSVKVGYFSKYDLSLIEPIKNFQRSHGLVDDGIIGKGTIERLNISPKEYLEKIKLNLERFRWNDYSDSTRYILVNIPDFMLRAYENGEENLEIKVCTGKKKDWKTPVLYSQISYLVLNPTWTVPQSIVKEEIISGLKKDSLYLVKRNFKAYKGGKEVSLDEINIKELRTKRYTLVQDPGAGNALGKIKFMFDNPFGVYLHDTPTRAPFNYVNRAVSHGCVRVEKPYLLTDFLLKENSNWTTDYVRLETGQQIADKSIISEFQKVRDKLRRNSSYGRTTEVRLNNKIPLFIDYYTAWIDKNGILNYRDDVYDKDIILKKHLPIW